MPDEIKNSPANLEEAGALLPAEAPVPRIDPESAPVAGPQSPVPAAFPPHQAADTIRRCQAGDLEAFEDLVRAYQPAVLRVARSLVGNPADAEDAAQETFLRLYRGLAKLDPDRDPIGWIYRLTVHASWDLLNRRQRSRALEDSVRLRPVEKPADPAAGAVATELRGILRASLRVLSPRARAVFVLHEVEDLEVAKVARVLRITRITVRRHLMRARTALRRYFEANHPELLDR